MKAMENNNMKSSRIEEELSKPFYPEELEWRVGEKKEYNGEAKILLFCYVSNRAIMNRLDEVVGTMGWKNTEPTLRAVKNEKTGWIDGVKKTYDAILNGFTTGISIKHNGEWITKYDGAEFTDFEPFKGGLSNAMKRAAVQWGIGRYLYELEKTMAVVHFSGDNSVKIGNSWFKWSPPILPDFAILGHNEPATLDQRQEMADFFKGADQKMQNWMLKNWFSISRANAYKAIMNMKHSDAQSKKTDLKKFEAYVESLSAAASKEQLSEEKSIPGLQTAKPVNDIGEHSSQPESKKPSDEKKDVESSAKKPAQKENATEPKAEAKNPTTAIEAQPDPSMDELFGELGIG